MSMRFFGGTMHEFVMDSRRCPVFVRAVVDRENGKRDVLNMPDDQIKPSEDLYVYKIVDGTWRQVFVRPGGEFQSGDYREYAPWIVDEISGMVMNMDIDVLRDNECWRRWVEQER